MGGRGTTGVAGGVEMLQLLRLDRVGDMRAKTGDGASVVPRIRGEGKSRFMPVGCPRGERAILGLGGCAMT